jgi:hypothetical protein
MKLLTLTAVTLFFGILSLKADTLVNGNFAEGRAHWKGDAKECPAADIPNSLSGGSPLSGGVVIDLKKNTWTKIYQVFPVHETQLYYNINFKLSDDYKIATPEEAPKSDTPDLSDLPIGQGRTWLLQRSHWTLVVTSLDHGLANDPGLQPKPGSGPQNLTGKLNPLLKQGDAVFLILFPPGEGSVTLYNISLSTNPPTN